MPILKKTKVALITFLSNIGSLWLERGITWAIQLSFIIITIQFGAVFISFPRMPNQIPLYYSKPWGEEQLAESKMLFLLPGISLAIMIINLALSVTFIRQEKFLSLCLNWNSLIVSILSLITLTKIIFLVT